MLKGYIKSTSNCDGLAMGWDSEIEIIDDLGAYRSIVMKSGEDLHERICVGWSDHLINPMCNIHLYRIKWRCTPGDYQKGLLLTGGNSGLRILANKEDEEFRTENDEHLPNGWGLPVIFIKDETDIIFDHQLTWKEWRNL
jgi:hypothetical protein